MFDRILLLPSPANKLSPPWASVCVLAGSLLGWPDVPIKSGLSRYLTLCPVSRSMYDRDAICPDIQERRRAGGRHQLHGCFRVGVGKNCSQPPPSLPPSPPSTQCAMSPPPLPSAFHRLTAVWRCLALSRREWEEQAGLVQPFRRRRRSPRALGFGARHFL